LAAAVASLTVPTVLGVGFRRLFWIGTAALLGVAALIGIVALVRGEVTDTDGKILGTLAITLGAGAVCLAGLALVDRRHFLALGWGAVAVGLAGYAVIVREIWSDLDGDEVFLTALLLLGVFLLATTARLLLRRASLEPLYLAHLVLLTFAAAATVWLIWDDDAGSDAGAKVLGVVWILTALSWFLVPVLGRTGSRPGAASERVVGTGPGRFEIELAEGERLVVRSDA
jgi:hypothetical protein